MRPVAPLPPPAIPRLVFEHCADDSVARPVLPPWSLIYPLPRLPACLLSSQPSNATKMAPLHGRAPVTVSTRKATSTTKSQQAAFRTTLSCSIRCVPSPRMLLGCAIYISSQTGKYHLGWISTTRDSRWLRTLRSSPTSLICPRSAPHPSRRNSITL